MCSVPPLVRASSASLRLQTYPTNRLRSRPSNGSIRLEDRKSYRSNRDSPNTVTSDSTLVDKVAGAPSRISARVMSTVARGREMRKVSESHATGTSSRDSIAPIEATADRTKNNVVKSCPPGMDANTAGMVRNSRLVPAVGSKPKLNTAGNTAMPAKMDTSRSQTITRTARNGTCVSDLK